MPYHLPRERKIQVLSLLSEGNSIRSVERLTGIHRDTVMRLLCRFGAAVDGFLDYRFGNLFVEHVQCDEIWTFVAKKEKRLTDREKRSGVVGDIYLFTALCKESKLLFSYALGRRNGATTAAFIEDVAKRLHRPPSFAEGMSPQISTDGWGAYQSTIRDSFGDSAAHGVIVKNYSNPEVGRYAPPTLCSADRTAIQNINDLFTICTSHVERCNLTIRTFIKRFTRLALGFSKKFENLAAATALHIGVYNFVRIHRTLKMTPALAAGICDQLWDMERFYDEVMDRERHVRRVEASKRLVARLNRGE